MTEKLFQHPGWLKVLSLVLAIMLWAYVRPNYTEETTKTFSDVPLTVLPHPAYELYDPDSVPDTVQIRAEGTGSELNRLSKNDLKAVLDLSHVSEPGKTTTLTIQVEGPERLTYVVFPSTVQVVLVQKGSEMFPVKVEPATGTVTVDGKDYRYTATPDVTQVSIGGRADYLSQVQQVQVRLETADLSPDADTISKAGVAVDAAGNILPGLTQPQVLVRLVWEELPPAKSLTVEPITTGSPPAGLTVTSITADPPSVDIRAQHLGDTLPDVSVIETEPIDLSGRSQSFTTTVGVLPPEGTNAAVKSVTVRVTIEETSVERVFDAVPITVVGAPAGGTVSVAPQFVAIRVKGRYSALAGLSASDISVQVDVSGLGTGSHNVPVQVIAPAGAAETEVDPAVVVATVVPSEPTDGE